LNIEHPTEKRMSERKYDLEERLLDYSVLIIRICEKLPNTRAGNHVAGQLIRSGTSALPNHGEAQSAESPADFVHKMKLALKELRESIRWLKLIRRVPLVKDISEADTLICETEELIRIFVKSIDTARNRSQKSV
jgi:four helix bundle protein